MNTSVPVSSLTRTGPKPAPHDSAWLHVTGQAQYIDDMPEIERTVYAAVGVSPLPHGQIMSIELDDVRQSSGVVAVLTAADIPGENNYGSVVKDDPILAAEFVEYVGQPVFIVLADSVDEARIAARKARLNIEPLPAVLTIDDALADRRFVLPSVELERGKIEDAFSQASARLRRRFKAGGQEHFYLEGQIAYAIPGPDRTLSVWSSTQHPGEVQKLVAHMARRPLHEIAVICRRMGGAFGGKETQAALFACVAGLGALHTGRPVKFRADRDDDMMLTGKRHAFLFEYEVGFDEYGVVSAFDVMLAADCGYSADLSGPVNDRAVTHVDNAYWLPNVRIVSHRCKTHTQSATAFRGFGGPQGIFPIEHALDEIAAHLGLDKLEVRKRNLYRDDGPMQTTPYSQPVEDCVIGKIVASLETHCDYPSRVDQVRQWNRTHRYIKRGLGFTPVKYGIAYNAIFLNQASATINIYTDGSILVHQGGTEMGQGLYIKIAHVVATVLGVPISKVKVAAAATDNIPNASATSASSGADLNGMAAWTAAILLKERLVEWAAARFGGASSEVTMSDGKVCAGGQTMPFETLARLAYFDRVQLMATGYYRVPKIYYEGNTLKGRPYYYFVYGAALTEVEVDLLSGEVKVIAVDVLQDVGESLNPSIDRGQIEGGFVQGMGWMLTEELVWDDSGRLRTHSPSTYKIPLSTDVPQHFHVALWRDGRNVEETVMRSKATGEPPFPLALSVYSAVRAALSDERQFMPADEGRLIALDTPTTSERIIAALDQHALWHDAANAIATSCYASTHVPAIDRIVDSPSSSLPNEHNQ